MDANMASARARAVILVGMVMACWSCAPALDPSLDVSQYAHTAWRIREGFTKGSITSIAQTADGYLWLGTEFGLFRFDGVRLTPWQPPEGQHLPSEFVTSVLAARDGTLWIGSMKGLASWKNGKLTIHPEMADQDVVRLLEDHEGSIWAGGIRSPNQARLCAFRQGDVACYGGDGSLGPIIIALYEDSKANLWVGVSNGFWRWKPGPPRFFSVPGQPNGIRSFTDDDKGALLVALSTGIGRLVDGRIETDVLPGVKPPLRTNWILRDRDGGLWIGTNDRGIIHFHQGRTDSFSVVDGLSSESVTGILEDREGNIWTTSDDGLDRFGPYSVSTLSLKQGLSNATAAVLAAGDGSVWIATLTGLDRWQHGQISPYGPPNGAQKSDGKLDGLPPNSLFQDSGGRIWASTNREFGYLDEGRYVTVRDYPGGYVHGIVQGPPGHLWVASQQAGLLHVFQGKVIEQFPWSRLGHEDPASAIAADPQGGLWLGFFRGGIEHFADGAIRTSYSTANGLGAGSVNQLRFGSQGALFVATEGGVSRLKDGRIATVTSRNGLPCDAVQWTVRDDSGSVWLYTSCGLLRIAQSEWDAWIANPARTMKPVVYDATDGVRTSAFVGGYRPRVTQSPDGKLWFVTGDGVSILDPRHLVSNNLPPPVHVEQITADHKTYEATPDSGGRVSLPPLVRDLQMDYTALSLVAPEKVRFRYKLEGWDRDWQDVGTRRQAFYSDLPPRNYVFRVIASNNSGVWNKEGASLDFSVAPAYYQTNWFRLLCAVAFLALLWGLYQLRLRELAREFNVRLDERVTERTRIARELHDSLLQNIQGLILKIHAIATRMPAADPTRQEIEKTLDFGDQILADGRDRVRNLRGSTVAFGQLPSAFHHVVEETAPGRSSTFKTVVEGAVVELHPLIREETYSIGREALINALTHSEANNIEVEIVYEARVFRVRIRDDGRGIDPGVLEKGRREGHWGLQGMRERAERLGAKLNIWSRPGSGTEVELTVPAATAYQSSGSSTTKDSRPHASVEG